MSVETFRFDPMDEKGKRPREASPAMAHKMYSTDSQEKHRKCKKQNPSVVGGGGRRR